MKKFKSILLLLCCFAMLTGFTPFEYKNEVIDDLNRIEIVDSLRNINVREDKIELLTNKLLNGELLDSMKEEYIDVEPVFTFTGIDGTYHERYEYPDGSVKQLRIDPGVFTGTIIPGDYQYGSYWWSHAASRAFATWGVVTASFYADFQGSRDHGVIQRIYDYGIVVAGGTFSNPSLSLVRANATSTQPAQAQLFFIGTATGSFGQATFYLRLFVPMGRNPYVTFSVLN